MVRLDYGVNSFVSQIVKSKSTAPESEINVIVQMTQLALHKSVTQFRYNLIKDEREMYCSLSKDG